MTHYLQLALDTRAITPDMLNEWCARRWYYQGLGVLAVEDDDRAARQWCLERDIGVEGCSAPGREGHVVPPAWRLDVGRRQ